MEGISDIKIIGTDSKRPPRIRKEPYIDIFFELSHQVPADWCRDFNALMAKHPSTPKINEKDNLYISAWVRRADDIPSLLEQLKRAVTQCSREYIERIERSIGNSEKHNTSLAKESGEQGRLNKIIAALDYDTAGLS